MGNIRFMKEFTKEELYDYLQYLMYCNYFEKDHIKNCDTFKEYQEFLKDTEVHMGDCTNDCCSCSRCILHIIEIEAQNALDILWGNSVGHCGKVCIKECKE